MENNKKNINIFKRTEESTKNKIITCAILSTIVIIGFLVLNNWLYKLEKYDYKITEDINIINSIEEFNIDKGNLIINGYVFLLGKDSSDSTASLFLIDIDNGKEIWSDFERIDREDVSSFFSNEYNYENSGFHASITDKSLKKDSCYELIFDINSIDENSDKVRKTISSNQFILNGQLYNYNPKEFYEPDLEIHSELLQNVFTDGYLYFYNKMVGMYIYKYDGKLYWIATEDFDFNENGQTYIPYHLYTSQTNKLPEEVIQHGFENLNFFFEEYEYKDETTEPYRVAIREIPNDYPITYITTGHYDRENSKWFWRGSFHLDNLFK